MNLLNLNNRKSFINSLQVLKNFILEWSYFFSLILIELYAPCAVRNNEKIAAVLGTG